MAGYLVRRLLASIPVFAVVALVVFGLIHLTPGDPAALLSGPDATREEIDAIRKQMGLDRPLAVQLAIWFRDILSGDLGQSIISKRSVASMIGARVIPTVSLALLTELVAISLSVPLGMLAAWKANSWIDRAIMIFATLGFSIPVFWLGFILIFLLAVKLPLFPVAGYVAPSEGIVPYLRHLALPVLATATVIMALITRMTRSATLEVLREDYIRTARAKGLAERAVLLRHALRNAAIPVVTIIGLGLAAMLSGLVVTESVFAIPGLGRLMVNAILARDYPIIQGAILVVSAVFVFLNVLVDVSYAYIDPRVRY